MLLETFLVTVYEKNTSYLHFDYFTLLQYHLPNSSLRAHICCTTIIKMTRLYAFAAAALLSLSSTETFAFTTFRSYTHNGRRTGLETSIHGMPNLPIEIPPVKEILSPADEFLRSIDSATDAVIQDAYENVFVKVSSLAHEVMSSSVVDEFSKQYAAHPEIAEILKQIEHVISELPPSAALIGSAVVTYVLASSALDKLSGGT